MTSRFALLFFLLVGCQHSPETSRLAVPAPREPLVIADSNLTQVEADSRSRLMRKVSYDLLIDLMPSNESVAAPAIAAGAAAGAAAGVVTREFSGEEKMVFDLSAPTAFGLALDFKAGGRVTRLKLNGQTVAPENYQHGRIALPADALRPGNNVVEISFRQKYAVDGSGLTRFQDPEDQQVYTWTSFEPYGANAMFPCFDQPDLKAKFKLRVRVPETWQVISATREVGVEKAKVDPQPSVRPKDAPTRDASALWTFPETPVISTYLFSLHAGPYETFSAQAGRIPLRLFVRRSLKRFVDPDLWFGITRAGLEFYSQYFAYPYPFEKYDQVIAPDFPDGGMENVAAVTFSEDFVSRGKTTLNERARLAEVVLHEMAHMWFGDLVTMRWWNGLWLNESFASYMAALAIDGSPSLAREFGDGGVDFHDNMKRWAYWEDQLVTTHPIEGRVADTKSAFATFDGITYGKGAAVLKQLDYFLGRERFREGVRGYIKSHDFQNTRIEHFIGALSSASGRDLVPWSRTWLMTQGLDAVKALFECRGGRLASLELNLERPLVSSGEGRPRRIDVGLFGWRAGRLELTSSIPIEFSGDESGFSVEPEQAKALPCPAFVLPNVGDRDFVRVILDGISLRAIERNLPNVADALTRSLLWTSLIEAQRLAELPPQTFLRIAEATVAREKNMKSVAGVLRTIRSGSDALRFLPQVRDEDRQARQLLLSRLESAIWKRAVVARADSDEQKVFFDGYLELVETEGGVQRLLGLLDKSDISRRIPLDQDRRWRVIVRLMAVGDRRGPRLLALEKSRDPSERGLQMAFAADAAQPRADVKDLWFDRLLKPSQEFTSARQETVLRTFLPPWQDDLRAAFTAKFFAGLLELSKAGDQDASERFARGMLPAVCTAESVFALKAFLRDQAVHLPPSVVKVIRVGIQEDDRCVFARSRVAGAH